MLAARQKAKEEAKARRAQREAIPPPSTPLAAPTDDLHKIAVQMREKFEKAKPGADGFIRISGRSVFSVIATPATTARLVVFFNRLANEVERRGYALEPEEKGLRITADGEVMMIAITEKTDRVPHVMTEKEEAALRRWEAERDRKQKRGEWWSDWDKPKVPEWDYVPNGKLSLTVNEGQHWDGQRRRFSDGKSRGLEDMVDQIMEGFATLAAAEKAKRAEAERRQKEWEEQEKRRRECERRRLLQQKRLEFLKRPMERLEDARRLEVFADDYLAAYPLELLPPSCRKLIEWAKEHASLLHKSVAPEQLTEILDKHRLMDDGAEIPSWISFP